MHVYCQHCNQRESDTMASSGRTLRWDAFITCLPEQGSTQLALAPRFKSFQAGKQVWVFKCMFYSPIFSMFRVLKSYVFEIYGPSNMFKNPFGLKIFSFDMTKWLGVSLGVISNTGEFRGILSKVREPQMDFVGRWKFLKKTLFFSCHFPMFGLLFCFKYLPKNKVKCEKHKKKYPAFWWCCTTKKTCTWSVLLVFVCFPWFLIYLPFPLNGEQLRPTSSPIFPRRMRKITSVLPIEMPCGKLKAYANVTISKGHWDPFGRDQTQMYTDFEGFPENTSALIGLVILWPLITVTKEETSQSGGQIRRVGGVEMEFSLDMPLKIA